MEQVKEQPFDATIKVRSAQATIWIPDQKNYHKRDWDPPGLLEYKSSKSNLQTLGDRHAHRCIRYRFWKARACLHRANRDLGETAALLAASLTTITAIQAVITIAKDKLELPNKVLHIAFDGYITILALIILLGAFRVTKAIHRRAQAEAEIDQIKKEIFHFLPMDEWSKLEE